MHKKNIRVDGAAFAYRGFSAEDGGVGIDRNVVLDVGVTLGAFDQLTAVIFGKAFRAERDAVIELHIVADFADLANDDARSMIDEKVCANRGAGMDVDTCSRMSPLRHHAWDVNAPS